MREVHRHYQICSCGDALVRRVGQKVTRVENKRGGGNVEKYTSTSITSTEGDAKSQTLPRHRLDGFAAIDIGASELGCSMCACTV